MSDGNTQHAIVPRLRFPEFRNSEGWQTPQLSELYGFKRTNTLSRDQLNYEVGTIKNIHYGDIHTTFQTRFRVSHEYVPYVNPEVPDDSFNGDAFCEEGDVVLADASEDLNDVGKAIEVVSLDGQQVVAGTHTILATRLGDEPVLGFGGYLFQSAAVRAGIHKEAQGAKVYGISANRISTIPIPLPSTHAEQRKIADCLGSLDDLIAAEGRKLEALRDHKKGLMQQLFPREGETQPRLRFPEFQDRWTPSTLGTVIDEFRMQSTVQDEYEVLTSARRGLMRQVEYYGEGRITKRDNIGFNIIPPDHITYRSRSDDGKFYFNINELGITGIISVYYPVFHAVEGSNTFLVALLNQFSADIGTHSVGSSQRVLPLTALMRYRIPLPTPPEQHRIADCLSALDTWIVAQTERLNALRTHKSGLMQQLFPNPEAK